MCGGSKEELFGKEMGRSRGNTGVGLRTHTTVHWPVIKWLLACEWPVCARDGTSHIELWNGGGELCLMLFCGDAACAGGCTRMVHLLVLYRA